MPIIDEIAVAFVYGEPERAILDMTHVTPNRRRRRNRPPTPLMFAQIQVLDWTNSNANQHRCTFRIFDDLDNEVWSFVSRPGDAQVGFGEIRPGYKILGHPDLGMEGEANATIRISR